MFLKNVTDIFRTVTFRLTLWYMVLFGALSIAVFLLVYVSLAWHLSKQVDEELLATAKEFNALYSEHGVEALQAEFQREAESRGVRRVFFLLLSGSGEVLASSDTRHWNAGELLEFRGVGASAGKPVFRTFHLADERGKVRVVLMPTGDGRLLELGFTLHDSELMMERYRETFGTAVVIMLVCGGLLGWLLARKAMAGVQRVTSTAAKIREGSLASRVAPGGEGLEIDNLVRTFNDMLDRVEALVNELKEVTDNIAHDLRSPITRIRGIAETTLMGRASIEDFQDMAAAIIEESDRLIEMINTMLEITKTEAGVAELASERVDVQEIAAEAVDLFRPLAEDKQVAVKLSGSPDPVFVMGDRAKLQRAVANLLDNAINYTPSGGRVTVSVHSTPESVRLQIADTGCGISEEELPHIFKRFYRGDRSRSTPGSGLGLSLALAIIKAHHGEIRVESSPGKGSKFTIIIPSVYL